MRVASMTTVMRDGSMVEIATVGDEGFIGVNALFGDGMVSGEAMMQAPDTDAEVMPIDVFRNEIARRAHSSTAFNDIHKVCCRS
jgi:hypothetical protein